MSLRDSGPTPIFVSYAREDRDAANDVALRLRSKGYRIFVDHDSIRGGQKWQARIEEELNDSHALVLCGTPAAFSSKYVKWELGVALAASKLIIPCQMKPFDSARPLPQLQWIDFTADLQLAYEKLFEALAPVHSAWPSNLMAGRVRDLQSTNPELSILLAVAAFEAYGPTPKLEQALRAALADWPQKVVGRSKGSAVSVAYDPDRNRVASASLGGTALMLDLTTGASRTLIEDDAPLTTVIFSPDGASILVASLSGRAWLLDAEGELVHEVAVSSLDVADPQPDWPPDMLHGASMVISRGTTLGERREHSKQGVLVAAFHPAGDSFVLGLQDGSVRQFPVDPAEDGWARWPHRDAVVSLHFSRDGRRIAAASLDATASVLDCQRGEWKRFTGHQHPLFEASFHPLHDWLLTACNDGTSRLIDPSTGEVKRVLQRHAKAVVSAQFDAQGGRVLTGSRDGTACLHELDTENPARVFRHPAGVTAALFTPDGESIVTACADGVVRVFDARGGDLPLTLVGPRQPIYAIATARDGSSVACGSVDGTTRVFGLRDSARACVLAEHGGLVACARFSPDGRRILTASDDGTARVYDVQSAAPRVIFAHHTGKVHGARFDPEGSRVVTASADGTARVFDSESGEQLLCLHAADVGDRKLYDPETGRSIHTFEGSSFGIVDALFSQDGSSIFTASDDRTARVFDARTGEALHIFRGHKAGLVSIAVDRHGSLVVSASEDNTVRVYEVPGGELRVIRCTRGYVPVTDGKGNERPDWRGQRITIVVARLDPEGRKIAVGFNDGPAMVFDALTGSEIAELTDSNGLKDVRFSPEGSRILTGSSDGSARIFDASTGALMSRMRGHGGRVRTAQFSPDGRLVVTASNDRTAAIFDADSGEPLAVLTGHEKWVRSAEFSPDGQRVVTASGAVVRIFEHPPVPELLRQARARVRRDLTPEERKEYGLSDNT